MLLVTKEDLTNDVTTLISVRAAIVKAGKILLVKERDKNYETPGGKLRHAETIEQGLTREGLEELGYSIIIIAPIFISTTIGKVEEQKYKLVNILFRCTLKKKIQAPLEAELKDIRWFSKKEVKELLKSGKYDDHDKELFDIFVKGKIK